MPKGKLFIADIHLGAKLYNIPELAKDNEIMLLAAFDKAVELKADLVIAGDLYDTQNPSEELVSFVSRLRDDYLDGANCLAISGDHDKRPGVNTTWVGDVNGFASSGGGVLGIHYKNFLNVADVLKNTDTADVEFLVLHGQDENMFKFVEEKKRLNLKAIDITKLPKLKAIVLGDIHKPMEGVIAFPEHKREIPVYYCGSLGVIKSDEIGTKTGLMYWDGVKFSRIPFPHHRTYAKFNLPDDAHLLPTFIKQVAKEKYKPLVVVSYPDDLDKEHIDTLKQLEKIVILRRSKSAKLVDDEEVINIRSELKTEDKISAVIDVLFKDDETLKNVFTDLLNSVDPKGVLDAYKEKMLEPTK